MLTITLLSLLAVIALIVGVIAYRWRKIVKSGTFDRELTKRAHRDERG